MVTVVGQALFWKKKSQEYTQTKNTHISDVCLEALRIKKKSQHDEWEGLKCLFSAELGFFLKGWPIKS